MSDVCMRSTFKLSVEKHCYFECANIDIFNEDLPPLLMNSPALDKIWNYWIYVLRYGWSSPYGACRLQTTRPRWLGCCNIIIILRVAAAVLQSLLSGACTSAIRRISGFCFFSIFHFYVANASTSQNLPGRNKMQNARFVRLVHTHAPPSGLVKVKPNYPGSVLQRIFYFRARALDNLWINPGRHNGVINAVGKLPHKRQHKRWSLRCDANATIGRANAISIGCAPDGRGLKNRQLLSIDDNITPVRI